MVIDNKKGSILQTDSSQWQWVSNVLMSTTQQNVFIFLPRPITDSLDIMVLKSMLTDIFAKSTRNIVVMYNGPENNAYFENGVRYISLADVGNPASANLADRTNGQKYLSFTVNGADVAYQFKNVF